MKVFYVDLDQPTREIREVDVTILQTQKRVWAVFKDGRRRLLGASIFFTYESALRCQLAMIQKILKYKSLEYKQPKLWAVANDRFEKLTKQKFLH